MGQDILYSQTVLAFENQFKEFPSCSTLVIETNIKIAIYEKNTVMHQREMSAGPTIAFPDNLICAYGRCSGVQQFKIPHIMQHKIFVYVTIFHVANPSGRVV